MKNLLAAALSITAGVACAADCTLIDDDTERLACYDKKSGRVADAAPTPKGENGNWKTEIEKSEFKDTTDVFLSISSEDHVYCRGYEPVRLVARCLENTTSLIIATQSCHLTSGHGGYGRVEYRIDDRKAKERSLTDSTDNRALGLWSGGRSIPVLKELIGSERLLLRFTPYNQSPVTARFDTAGLENAIKPLREACGW